VRGHLELDIEVTGRTTAGTNLTLRGQMNPVTSADPRRNLDVDRAGRADASVSRAFHAGVWNDAAVAVTGWAGLSGPDITDEGSLHVGYVALTMAGGTGNRPRAFGSARAVAPRAEHGRIHP
jgi:hypothetical protein